MLFATQHNVHKQQVSVLQENEVNQQYEKDKTGRIKTTTEEESRFLVSILEFCNFSKYYYKNWTVTKNLPFVRKYLCLQKYG